MENTRNHDSPARVGQLRYPVQDLVDRIPDPTDLLCDFLNSRGLVGESADVMFDDRESAGHVVIRSDRWFSRPRRMMLGQHGREMPGVPIQCDGQRFEGARTAAPTDHVVL
jgi:hypothetical protein